MMNDELLKCLRATANEGEFASRGTSKSSSSKMESAKKAKAESADSVGNAKKVTDQEVKPGVSHPVEGPDATNTVTNIDPKNDYMTEEKEDGEFDLEFDDDASEIPVIDTELDGDEESDIEAVDYIGKYVVICPICLHPLFSDKSQGEIYCPVCDQDVEIEKAEGQVVAPEEKPADEYEPAEDEYEPAEDEYEPAEDEYEPAEDEVDVKDSQVENLSAPPSTKPYARYTAADLDPVRSGGNPQKIIDQYKKGEISDKAMKSYIAEDNLKDNYEDGESPSTKVEISPEGSVNVSTDEVNVSIASPAVSPSTSDNEVVSIDDFDTDNFDCEVTDIVGDIYDDDDLEYESKSVYRNGKGFIVEGVVRSGSNSVNVRFVCNESRKSKNIMRVEGLKGIIGNLIVETRYNSRKGKLKVESAAYKFLTKVEGKAKILSNVKDAKHAVKDVNYQLRYNSGALANMRYIEFVKETPTQLIFKNLLWTNKDEQFIYVDKNTKVATSKSGKKIGTMIDSVKENYSGTKYLDEVLSLLDRNNINWDTADNELAIIWFKSNNECEKAEKLLRSKGFNFKSRFNARGKKIIELLG